MNDQEIRNLTADAVIAEYHNMRHDEKCELLSGPTAWCDCEARRARALAEVE